MQITPHQAKYFAYELTGQHAGDGVDRLSRSLFDASVDLNPHQINAALFALNNPLNQGVVLADEVGLGKTIEAGLVLCQYWAERKRRILIICPASLRRQWAQELKDKFNIPSQILDAKTWRQFKKEGVSNPLNNNAVVIMSYHYAARLEEALLIEPWNLAIIDEAHKLRNAHRANNKMGQALKRALQGRKKLLLTATPLQNSLMELYGLSTLIDEYMFGDEKVFRQNYITDKGSLPELKHRLQGFIHRTLRKDVLEYIRYTQRKALTVPFTPTPEEQRLYNSITALLEKEVSYALPVNQRHLTGLILRKLMASSSAAVLNTLHTIKYRLEALQQGDAHQVGLIETWVEQDDLEQDYLEESDNSDDESESDIDHELLSQEILELATYIKQAESIEIDSKATALLTALNQGFEQMSAMGAPRKAIIFTESKRTQEYLAAFLAGHGHEDKIVTFSGSNNHPDATAIYQAWLEENAGADKVSGSPQIDRRTALIDHFRQDAEIMIATEAAAEGVNLQFCSLLINYDLPWNPQRVEQRIGRCHRYGQKFDVVVINFLNESNVADQRVLELLSEKFHLFDGVFGASDEVLGSIESGLDFEKRIQAIYETCRSPDAIDTAFQQLQKELEAEIDEKMSYTRQLLIENFDEDIHDLLKIQLNATEQRLDKFERWFWLLTCHQLQHHAVFNADNYSFSLQTLPDRELPSISLGRYQLLRQSNKGNDFENFHAYRLSHPLAEWVLNQALSMTLEGAEITFLYSKHNTKITVIESLLGKSGTLSLQRYTVDSLEQSEDHLIFAAELDDGVLLPPDVAQKLMHLPAELGGDRTIDVSVNMAASLERDRNAIMKEINDRNLTFFEQETSKLDAWADDLKEGLEQSIRQLDKDIKQVRRESKIAPTLEEKLALQKQQRKLESLRNRQRRDLFDKQDEVDERREALIDTLEGKLSKKTDVQDLFTIRWSVK